MSPASASSSSARNALPPERRAIDAVTAGSGATPAIDASSSAISAALNGSSSIRRTPSARASSASQERSPGRSAVSSLRCVATSIIRSSRNERPR